MTSDQLESLHLVAAPEPAVLPEITPARVSQKRGGHSRQKMARLWTLPAECASESQQYRTRHQPR